MDYRTFSDYYIGYSHVKSNMECEDYAASFSDPQGRYYIGVSCDGHSDKNCFRSATGARFGCESAIEVLQRFFEAYLNQEGTKVPAKQFEDRIKRSIKVCWDRKVYADIEKNPVTEKELAELNEQVQKLYASGKSVSSIYGTTLLAVAICEEFFLALQIGDGTMLCVDQEGKYDTPLPEDPKSASGEPSSLCDDEDLFTRDKAFRSCVLDRIPQIVLVTSDGMGDSMDSLIFKELIRELFTKIETMESPGQESQCMNENQLQYIRSCLAYWAGKGNGREDDCSMAAVYLPKRVVPLVKIPAEQAIQLWTDTVHERNDMVRDYERRKCSTCTSIDKQYEILLRNRDEYGDNERELQTRKTLEELKQILKAMETKEKEKIADYDQKLSLYKEYIYRAEAMIPNTERMIMPTKPDARYLEEDSNSKESAVVREDCVIGKIDEERSAGEESVVEKSGMEESVVEECVAEKPSEENFDGEDAFSEASEDAGINENQKEAQSATVFRLRSIAIAAREFAKKFSFGWWDE